MTATRRAPCVLAGRNVSMRCGLAADGPATAAVLRASALCFRMQLLEQRLQDIRL